MSNHYYDNYFWTVISLLLPLVLIATLDGCIVSRHSDLLVCMYLAEACSCAYTKRFVRIAVCVFLNYVYMQKNSVLSMNATSHALYLVILKYFPKDNNQDLLFSYETRLTTVSWVRCFLSLRILLFLRKEEIYWIICIWIKYTRNIFNYGFLKIMFINNYTINKIY